MTYPCAQGKFITIANQRHLVKGVAYGTFAPDQNGMQFPGPERVRQDFEAMAAAGINTVRTYTVPSVDLLDEAARHGLRMMIGVPWSQHIAFLDDRRRTRDIRQGIAKNVRTLGSHPGALLFAVGNEIPPAIVRWHGRERIERFLRELYDETKAASPETLLTYVNFPPTEYLDLDCFDVCAFNVYLHREPELRAYLARLQQIAGDRPLLLAEAGADGIREGTEGQAAITAMHLRAAFREGLCGAIAFSWTDEWWRGGDDIVDWAFGLVDADRQPKPALAAVSTTYAEAPFSAAERRAWPKVSVIVCAYNAADTIGDCLASLGRLSYPDYEVLVVNDGSGDETGEIARQYPVRLIDVPNGGLSAARNLGLAEATGQIVAYTDADVRVDPDWLTYLVQPFLTSDVVAAGGPNIVPPDDPFIAQCVARSPGGPIHVLLDDRIAEHVPGCNMAFRRDALLAIQGFNPVYLRAGDDVDVCWRLQAKKQKIGFSPAALVWHHHRASIKGYWRQQAGYGEGEAWLEAHHPEKFARGTMVWHGRIYSPLPFVRSLSGRHINTGVWGTAAFPSIYRTFSHPVHFLPHSPAWLGVATLLVAAGAMVSSTPYVGLAALLLLAGGLGWSVTIARCLLFGWRSNLHGLRTAPGPASRLRHRLLIAWLHFLQPLARFYGRLRGMWSPPLVIAADRVTGRPWKVSVPSVPDARATAHLLMGGATEQQFWSESWVSHDALLTEATGLLRASRPARHIEVDDGWHEERDVSVAIGRWGWLDVRALIEEHGGAKCLLRVGMRLRPALVGIILALALAVLALSMSRAAVVLRWPSVSVACVVFVAGVFARAAWETTNAVAVVRKGIARAAMASGMAPMQPTSVNAGASWKLRPYHSLLSQRVQAAVVGLLVASATASSISFVQRTATSSVKPAKAVVAARRPLPMFETAGDVAVATNGEVYFADARRGLIGRLDRVSLDERQVGTSGAARDEWQLIDADWRFKSPAAVAIAPNGDVYVADAQNSRICRIDRATGMIVTVAGSGAAGFDGDLKQATQAALHWPNAVAVARNGDLYLADTMNHRVRVVSRSTGLIRTVAGDGNPGPDDRAESSAIGDGGPAVRAHLNGPTDIGIAPNGDLYIADMGHNRIRRVNAGTGTITTIAGNGLATSHGDAGPAVAAKLAGPAALALAGSGRRLTIFVAEYFGGNVRVISPDGSISTLASRERLVAPSRLAYRPDGWLYVASESGAVTAINVSLQRLLQVGTVASRTPVGTAVSVAVQAVQ